MPLVTPGYFMKECEMAMNIKSNSLGSVGLAICLCEKWVGVCCNNVMNVQIQYTADGPEDRKSYVLVTSLEWKLCQMIYHSIKTPLLFALLQWFVLVQFMI